jgi:hypothetical protein
VHETGVDRRSHCGEGSAHLCIIDGIGDICRSAAHKKCPQATQLLLGPAGWIRRHTPFEDAFAHVAVLEVRMVVVPGLEGWRIDHYQQVGPPDPTLAHRRQTEAHPGTVGDAQRLDPSDLDAGARLGLCRIVPRHLAITDGDSHRSKHEGEQHVERPISFVKDVGGSGDTVRRTFGEQVGDPRARAANEARLDRRSHRRKCAAHLGIVDGISQICRPTVDEECP